MSFLKGRGLAILWSFVGFLGVYSVLWWLGSVSLEMMIKDAMTDCGDRGVSVSVGVVRCIGYPLRISAVCHDVRIQKYDSELDVIVPFVSFQTNLLFPFHQTIWARMVGGLTISTPHYFFRLFHSRFSGQIKPLVPAMTIDLESLVIASRNAVVASFPELSVQVSKKDGLVFQSQGSTFVPRASGFSEMPVQFRILGRFQDGLSSPVQPLQTHRIFLDKSHFILDNHKIQLDGFLNLKEFMIESGDFNLTIPHQKCWMLLLSNFLPKDFLEVFLPPINRILWGDKFKKQKKAVLPFQLRDGRLSIKNLPFGFYDLGRRAS